MGRVLGAITVFVCSAAVLVLEILAGRLMAPYVGVSITTYTGAIGSVLAGIAAGAWLGGRMADRLDRPGRLLPLLALVGAALAFVASPLITLIADATVGWRLEARTLALSGLVFLPPAALLSAASPIVVKLLLASTERTGSIVGLISAVGTTGALCGTFLTGFVFLAAWTVQATLVGVGGVLVALAVVLLLDAVRRPPPRALALALAMVASAGIIGGTSQPHCDRDTQYFCVRVLEPTASTRVLMLDDLVHSIVDLNTTELQLPYSQAIGAVIDTMASGPIDAVHVGGGGLAIPRWLAADRPGSTNTVLEIDPDLVDVALRQLGGDRVPDLHLRIGDARVTMRQLADDSADVVVGDAFASRSVPWHLTTKEFLTDVRRVLRPGGIYVMNLTETQPPRFSRAEAATLASLFDEVALLSMTDRPLEEVRGNLVLVAGDRLALDDIRESIAAMGGATFAAELSRWVRGSPVLTDGYAPVDQWLQP